MTEKTFIREIHSEEFGSVRLRSLPLPEGVIPYFVTYTPSGRVACQFRREGDPADYFRIMTLNDDGSEICIVYEGPLALNPRANGFRYMPFTDNKRAYIGDYILECEPDCDHCETARFIPIRYPEALVNAPGLWMIWSENVVAPDNEHIVWNTLAMQTGAYVAKLRREADCYELDNVRTISTMPRYEEDPAHPGCLKASPMRGGEVKQFLGGGLALDFVGVGRGCGNSFYQALDSEETAYLTQSPGYDETTMVSPDEKLGLVMSTRFSPATSCALVGLIPRCGNLNVKHHLALPIYLYAIAGAREDREAANIGPALVRLDRSKTELSYAGLDLHDPENRFVYYSPMSWHPSSQKVMWNEGERRSIGDGRRVMIAELPDYVPGKVPPIVPVPENIPYATPGIAANMEMPPADFRTAGKVSGYVRTYHVLEDGQVKEIAEYVDFSDDGKSFLSGRESAVGPGLNSVGTYVYESKLTMTGEKTGEMDVRLVFRRETPAPFIKLLSESRGFCEYDGQRIDVAEMDLDE